MTRASLVLLLGCGLPPVKPPTAVEACDRAAECKIESLANRDACVACVDCFITLNPGDATKSGIAQALTKPCPELAELSRKFGLTKCASEWQDGGTCVSGGKVMVAP